MLKVRSPLIQHLYYGNTNRIQYVFFHIIMLSILLIKAKPNFVLFHCTFGTEERSLQARRPVGTDEDDIHSWGNGRGSAPGCFTQLSHPLWFFFSFLFLSFLFFSFFFSYASVLMIHTGQAVIPKMVHRWAEGRAKGSNFVL